MHASKHTYVQTSKQIKKYCEKIQRLTTRVAGKEGLGGIAKAITNEKIALLNRENVYITYISIFKNKTKWIRHAI